MAINPDILRYQKFVQNDEKLEQKQVDVAKKIADLSQTVQQNQDKLAEQSEKLITIIDQAQIQESHLDRAETQTQCCISLNSCITYCCGSTLTSMAGAVTTGLIFKTTLAAIFGGIGGASLGWVTIFCCQKAKKRCFG